MTKLQAAAAEDETNLDDDQVQDDEIDQGDVTGETGADLAPATGESQDKKDDGVQKAINKQHAKYREEERKRIVAEKRATDAEGELNKLKADTGDIVIPEMPDSFDEDFDEKVKLRDEAIAAKATQEAQAKSATERQADSKKEAEEAGLEHVNSLIADYNKRIHVLGLNPVEIQAAAQKVNEYGISGEVAEHILSLENGPLVTKYLAENPIVLDDLRNMSPIQAALKINSEISEAASTLKPEATGAPDPTEVLSGSGAGEQGFPLTKGAKFT